MNRSGKIAQAYGYAVCFIAVVTLLFASKSMIDAAFDLSAPLRADRYITGFNLSSFESYRRDRIERRDRPVPQGAPATADLSEEELRRMYEADRADHIGTVRFKAMRSLVSNLLLVGIAFVLFITHWRWLRRVTAE